MKLNIETNKERRLFAEATTLFLLVCMSGKLKDIENILKQPNTNPFTRDANGFGLFEYTPD